MRESGQGKPTLGAFLTDVRVLWRIGEGNPSRVALGALFVIVARLASLAVPYAPRLFMDEVIARHHPAMILPLILGLIAAVLIQTLATYAVGKILIVEGQRVATNLRCAVQRRLLCVPVSALDGASTGELASRAMTDVDGVRTLLGQDVIEFLGGCLAACLILVVMARISLVLTGVTLVFIVALWLFLRYRLASLKGKLLKSRSIAAKLVGSLTEALASIGIIKSFAAEGAESARFQKGAEALRSNSAQAIVGGAIIRSGMVFFVRALTIVVLGVGTAEVMAHVMSPGELFSFVLCLTYLVMPATQAASVGSQLADAMVGTGRTFELLKAPIERREGARIEGDALHGQLSFDDVHFSYRADRAVLRGVTFEVKPGSVVAIVGASGSGKSTIAALMLALRTPDRGAIRLDDVAIASLDMDFYRGLFGVVSQDAFIVSGTVRENILFGRPEPDDHWLKRVCALARVDEFLGTLPSGLDSQLGERGVNLSGGQRQRIAVARALLGKPRFLVFDEATSGLDVALEAAVMQGIAEAGLGSGTLIIAHRLSTVRAADEILVLDDGLVMERGSHNQLLAAGGRYAIWYGDRLHEGPGARHSGHVRAKGAARAGGRLPDQASGDMSFEPHSLL